MRIVPQGPSRVRCCLVSCDCAADHRHVIESRITVSADGCWIWQRALSSGYGNIKHVGRMWRAHRLSYVAWRGPIPKGLVLDHLCLNKSCVNPWHLEAVTDHANILRAFGVPAPGDTKTICRNGHAMFTGPRGRNKCEACEDYPYVALIEDDPRHGTTTAYWNHGCRCEECRVAGAALNREQKAKRRELPRSDPRHGTYNGYTNWGCRCAECREANRQYRIMKVEASRGA